MKTLLVLALLALGPRLAAAASPYATVDSFSKLLSRYAVRASTITEKVKNPCLCKDASASMPKVGVLVYQVPTPGIESRFKDFCAVPQFDASGNNSDTYETCTGEFEILAK
ncbi:MAG: hypothetical protein FJ144_07745 [Deltaproteobacteria bacterium]|nr:hypothetical protein [Deltaproteobacteria bacterium]